MGDRFRGGVASSSEAVAPGGAVGPRGEDVSTSGPGAAVADVRSREASPDRRGASSEADRVLRATEQRWLFRVSIFPGGVVGAVPLPRGDWLRCGICAGAVVVRAWQFHTRPGRPTVPRRCDVHVKCSECAAGWWHGVAISESDWNARPQPFGIRAALLSGSNFEPKLWASDRRGRG